MVHMTVMCGGGGWVYGLRMGRVEGCYRPCTRRSGMQEVAQRLQAALRRAWSGTALTRSRLFLYIQRLSTPPDTTSSTAGSGCASAILSLLCQDGPWVLVRLMGSGRRESGGRAENPVKLAPNFRTYSDGYIRNIFGWTGVGYRFEALTDSKSGASMGAALACRPRRIR